MAEKKGWWLTLLAMAGLGGIAAVAAARPKPREPRGTMDTPGEAKPAAREWRIAYRGANPSAAEMQSLGLPPPKFKVGEMVYYQLPAGLTPEEVRESQNDPMLGQPLMLKRIRAVVAWVKDAAGVWSREMDSNRPGTPRAARWAYETDKTGDDTGIDEKWLSAKGTTVVRLPPEKIESTPAPAPLPAPVTQRQEAAMNLPLYPQGLTVSKGSGKGTVTAISKAADGYHYAVHAGVGPFGSDYQGSEAEVRDKLAGQAGQQSYGFAFPEGVTLTAGKVVVQIQKRTLADGKRGYLTDAGPIEEPKLILKLYEGLKG